MIKNLVLFGSLFSALCSLFAAICLLFFAFRAQFFAIGSLLMSSQLLVAAER